ncbi:MAG: diaminopimelate epimerase [Candidatus Abyssobacteria bacterium SURF_17]|uniref:Diaminopimelate epimerase n=1 Tax=Candidatus Abyssobacteria bacterium SURF_17 TaxID=2093361 RepID=A0A419ESA8_9BACT|nr:MAG: diaminopimelate epimerase [Candidatus Abyssubacteria bacterium SURF_17]
MKFTKMHGLGNDFVVVDGFSERVEDAQQLTVTICDRRTGVGADGLIIIMPSDKADFRMHYINSDGSIAEMCGNGIRCLSKYAYEHGLTEKTEFLVETPAGLNRQMLTVENGRVVEVSVDMGTPKFLRSEIPMRGENVRVIDEPLEVDGTRYRITALSTANPHAVIFVEDVNKAPVSEVGPKIEWHPAFPNRTNVEFVHVIDRNNIRMRIWERGCGETLASGSGSSASAVASIINGFTERTVNVHVRLGTLRIHWPENGAITMTGPATEVFTGEWPD